MRLCETCGKTTEQKYLRFIMKNGATHVYAACTVCGQNYKPGEWVAQYLLNVPVESLPIGKNNYRPQ